MRAVDLAGSRVGQLTVIRQEGKRGPHLLWVCRCDCGEEALVRRGDLTRRDGREIRSCGCLNHRAGPASSNWKGHGGIPSSYWSVVLDRAERRGLAVNVSIEEAWQRYLEQGGVCALTGWPIHVGDTASLDRINSRSGYESDNIQWLHKDINRLKSNWSQERFTEMCNAVTGWG